LEDRDIETVGDLKLALEGIEDSDLLAIHAGPVKDGKIHNIGVRRFGNVVILYCKERKE
jgi:hypothetical protein